jgi:hypothetical protein
MQLNQMVYQMCHEVLAAVDINAIRKARGFSQSESATRSTFENAYLSSAGLANAMATLNESEVAMLHLLKAQPKPVEIDYFARLYSSSENDRYRQVTYSQRFKGTLDSVKKQLVRKGVLVMFELKNSQESVQMARWRFVLPPGFARFLPPLVANPHLSNQPGSVRDRLWVQKVREALGDSPVSAITATGAFKVTLEQGTLWVGNQPFQADLIEEWKQAAWESEMPASDPILQPGEEYDDYDELDDTLDLLYDDEPENQVSLQPVAATRAILETLAPGQWVTARQLAAPLKIFSAYYNLLPPEKICHSGWRWGCLARLSEGGETYYRLADRDPGSSTIDFGAFLQASGEDGALRVDLDVISTTQLEQLNALASLYPAENHLLARPDPVKLGRASPEQRQSALVNWLIAQTPAFAQALEQVEQRWGKVIVHNNLLVARVRDLSLRVQIERELKDQVVVLNTEFIAFPPALRPAVERLLKKSGFVVKEVRA